MMRNAHASETMSSVRATEQFRSSLAAPGAFARGGRGCGIALTGEIFAVAERAITCAPALREPCAPPRRVIAMLSPFGE